MPRNLSAHRGDHLTRLGSVDSRVNAGTAAALADEPVVRRWARRAVTIPVYLCLGTLAVALLPLSVPLALCVDALRRTGRLATLRCTLAITLYLACEAVGLAASLILWLAAKLPPFTDEERFVHWNLVLQRYWARTLFEGARRLFSMHTEVTGADELERGPLFVFSRHASTLDTLLPAVFVSHPDRLRLRWIMKEELRWDPCLDVVGRRTRNAFIRRGSDDPEREIAIIRRLAADLGASDGVLIFPEGTRFSASKRARAIEQLRAGSHPERAETARALRHVLPPRLGGPTALLAMRPDVDVVFLAHRGFEGISNLNDIWSGALVGRQIRLHFWRVPSARIPREEAARARWLDAEWMRIDEWIEAQEKRPA